MKTIYLVRHGQKQPDPGDPGLTDLGVKQSIQTGEFLKNLKINQVISSPFKRTLETAKNISSVLNIQYQISDQLVEISVVTDNHMLVMWVKGNPAGN